MASGQRVETLSPDKPFGMVGGLSIRKRLWGRADKVVDGSSRDWARPIRADPMNIAR
ncbi:MAG: hypothetical protein LCH92_16965 [Proteobacteria bacterium]|nr:hypothetical protein [Pseudomonadota bacterium]